MLHLFSSKKNASVQHPVELNVDLHSHLIPAIDDGAENEMQSLNLIRGLQALGYKKCITTPHIYRGVYNNTRSIILTAKDKLQAFLNQHHIQMEVIAVAEYFFDEDFFALIENNDLMTFGKNQVLLELPFSNKPAMLNDIIFKLFVAGYQPVLAHPERYVYMHDHRMTDYQALKYAGVQFQMNLMSLAGYYGKEVESTAHELLHGNMIEYAGSDVHKEKHLPVIQAALHNAVLAKYHSSGRLLNHLL